MADEGKKYVVHGMYAQCSMGTMKNYLNTDVGHGVVYQGQPLLNANDHAPQINLTHFGDCNSKMIFEEAKKQADEKYKADAGDSFFERVGKSVAKNVTKAAVTIQGCFGSNKCQLDTPLPWRSCNEEHMIDGAPALTVGSICPCKFGGIISIIETPEPEPETPEQPSDEMAAKVAEAVMEAAAAMPEVMAEAMEQTAYVNMMAASYGFNKDQALLIQKAYNLSKSNNGSTHDFVANMAAFVYGGSLMFGTVDGIPKAEKARKYFEGIGLSEDDVENLEQAITAQYSGTYNGQAQEEKDFAHEMAVYAGYFNSNKLHRGIMDLGIVQAFLGNMETLNSYEGDVYSASMGYDDMNTDMDALNIYNLYTETAGQDFWEVLTEYNQDVLSGEINRAESFLENLGNGDAEKGLENLKKDLDYGGLGGWVIGRGKKKNEKEETKQGFLDYIEEVYNEKTQE